MKSVSKNELIKLISTSGQIAEHKSEKMQEHGMDEEELLKALTMEERETLKELLKKLQKQWFTDHAARMKAQREKK